ncbi:MAG TPA: hypothetical protein VGT02_05360 [Methylomirabilota bacterium]|jgi:hypothetical protein|nr:hypothetical protein [Methylomirabilota bacterium]
MIRRGPLLLGLGLALAAGGPAGAQNPPGTTEGRGVCYTELGWCPLPNPAQTPVEARCYCILPDGRYVYGVTKAWRYSGYVNPYFNPHPPPVPSTIR